MVGLGAEVVNAGHTILVVDDNPDVLRLLAAAIGNRYVVITAQDGQCALNLLAAKQVHVLIADERMPNMSGTDLLREVRSRHPQVVRLLFTAGSSEGVLEAINTGLAYRYIPKPYTRPEFRDVIQSACDKYTRGTILSQISDARAENQTRSDRMDGRLTRIEDVVTKNTGLITSLAKNLDAARHQVASVGTRVAEVEHRVDEELSSPGVDVNRVIDEVRRQQSSLADHETDISRLEAQIAAIVGAPKPAPDGSSKPPPTLATIAEDGEARGEKTEKAAKRGIVLAGGVVVVGEIVLEVLKHVWK